MTEPETILPTDVVRLRTSVMAATKKAVPAKSYVAAPISPKKYTALLAHHCRDSMRISLTSAGVRRIASRSFANIRTPLYKKGTEGIGRSIPYQVATKIYAAEPYASTPKNAPTMPTAMVATISTMGLIFLDSSQ